ncbi:MAG: transglycosylase SLT domain-containing protein [Candidatus Kerfeldbacteria bacterium]|nr:transglycosylase SLT domain-containing protein [Candidatus Kerfeldbacteria bacterium]
MLKRSLKITASCVLVLSLAQANAAQAQETPTSLPITLATVQRARAILQEQVNAEAAIPVAKRPVVTSRQAALKVTLAVWHDRTDEITVWQITKQQKKVTVKEPKGQTVKVLTDNGVNTEFELSNRPELHVLAIKHPIFIDIGTARRPRFRLENVAYVPYSDFLATPEIVQAGADYLNANVQAVYDELRNLGVRSRAFPNLPLAQAIEPNLIKAIIAIEHVNAATLLNGNLEKYLKIFYVILASNQNQAYAYARSSASARGLAQFIPTTYQRLVKARPDLSLHKNFDQGMTDPYNAIKAELALLDSNLTLLPKATRQQHEGDERTIGAYLAAIYNGGSTRVRRAITRWGDKWAQDHATDLANLKQLERTQLAEASRLTRALANKKITAKEKKSLQAQYQAAKNKASQAKNDYATGLAGSLKRETAQYVAKYYLAYDYFAAR